jgi:hypothetical protein
MFGTNVPQYSGADGNGNSIVDAGDYTVWRSQLGATGAAAGGSSLNTVEADSSAVAAKLAADSKVVPSRGDYPLSKLPITESVHRQAAFARDSGLDSLRPSMLAIVELSRKNLLTLAIGDAHLSHSHSNLSDSKQEGECGERVADAIWAAWPKIARFGG